MFAIAGTAVLSMVTAADAARITNPVAVFSGIDKITGRITTFDVYIGETVQFGALQVTPRVCYSRDDTEAPKTDTFVEVDEITLDRKIRRIFTGWMFADSPGLNAVEHPVYDVWLNSCKAKSDLPPPDSAAKQ
ncbi:glycosyl hydrolase family 5 [Rhizobium sp. Root73]|nr:glycosyl hydrolase family 5 [Rhizobium sp. Root1204]KQX98739.1 glycosyl hydrolase family 5 [Rhizobium sp. Root1334]KRC10648.1 glycosyl hydrolase family 5 [Rhizobium sp. Root73]